MPPSASSRSKNALVQLGSVGVWLGAIDTLPLSEELEAARELEELGYSALWFGETPFGRDALVHAESLLGATERVVVATGILNIWLRTGIAARNGAWSLGEAHPGRFVLGAGVSHPSLVERTGRAYTKPLSEMRRFLDEYESVDYLAPAPAEPVPVVLAALAPRMLELARERTDGAHPYLVAPEHTRIAREALGAGKLLAPEQAFVLETDPARARELARAHLRYYLAAPNYQRSWRRLGFGDEDFSDGGSDRIVDALVVWGDEAAVLGRIREHLDAGADHVCVQAIGAEPLAELRRLAPALS